MKSDASRWSMVIVLVWTIVFMAGCFEKYPDMVISVNDGNFGSVVMENEAPVVVFFYWDDNSSRYDPILAMMNKYSAIIGNEVVFAKYCMTKGKVDEDYGIQYDMVCIRFEEGELVDQLPLEEFKEISTINAGKMGMLLEDYVQSALNYSSRFYQPETINADHFKEKVLESKLPVVVQFTMKRSSCSIINSCASNFVNAAQRYSDISHFYFIDADDAGVNDLMKQYEISNLPTVVTFHNGKQTLRSDRNIKSPYYEANIFGMIFQHL
jgi:thioredoxin-like negative regulator of GroEL